MKRLNRDGLPIDGKDWTEDDWRDLHNAIETIKRKVAKRHAEQGGNETDTRGARESGRRNLRGHS